MAEWRKGDTQNALDRQRRMVADFPQNTEANGTFTDMAVLLDGPEAADRLTARSRTDVAADTPCTRRHAAHLARSCFFGPANERGRSR